MRLNVMTLALSAIVAVPGTCLADTVANPSASTAAVTAQPACRPMTYAYTPIALTNIAVTVGTPSVLTALVCKAPVAPRADTSDALPWEFQGRQMQSYGGG